MSDAFEVAQGMDAAFNAKDGEARPLRADAELAVPGARLKGREQIREFERAFWEAFPDVQLRIERQIADGPLVAGEGVLTGTHTGALQTPQGEVPPTERSVELAYMRIMEVQGGEVASEHIYFDQLGLLGQLGLGSAPPGSGR